MICYVHHLPGRLRVRIPAAKGNAITTERLADQLQTLEGISSVAANPVTGSLLIRYDTSVTSAAGCLAALNVTPIRPQTSPATNRLASKVAEAALWYVLEKTAERCFLLILAALV